MGWGRKTQRTHDLRLFRGIISPWSPPPAPWGPRKKSIVMNVAPVKVFLYFGALATL